MRSLLGDLSSVLGWQAQGVSNTAQKHRLLCVTPACPYVAHSDAGMFHLCCLRCFECNLGGVGKKKHGYQRILGAKGAKRAERNGDPPLMFNFE